MLHSTLAIFFTITTLLPPPPHSNDSSPPIINPLHFPPPLKSKDVDNKEFKSMLDKYFKGDEDMLPSIMEAILKRKLSGKHEDTDDELMEVFRTREPIDDVDDEDFEDDFDKAHETDEDIDDLYNARDIVVKKMVKYDKNPENRKDLRTLLSLIEEADKANKLVDDDRTSYVKERLRSNSAFMEKLHAKSMRSQESNKVPA